MTSSRPTSFHTPRTALALAAASVMLAACVGSPNHPDPAMPKSVAPATPAMAPVMAPVVPATATGMQLDALFVDRALQNGMLEVAASRLALHRSRHPLVREFASHMVQDHTTQGAILKQLMTQRGDVAAVPSPADEALFERLRMADGQSFDQLYVQLIGVAAHEEALTLYRQQAAQGSDPALRDFAASTIPTLEQHERMAQALDARLR